VSKRIRGEGSVSLRPDGRWQGQLSRDGVREAVYERTQQEAADKLMDLRAHKGLPRLDQRLTVQRWLEAWLETSRPRLRPSTATRYRQLVEQQLVPALGHLKLASMTPAEVTKGLAGLQAGGLSPRTVSHCRAVLRTALADAERDGLVARNVARLATIARVPDPSPVVLSPDQATAVIEAIQGPSLRRLATVAIFTGLRLGEQLGLTWADIDFERHQLHVRHSLERIEGAYVLVEPKSTISRRVVALIPQAFRALEEEHAAQAEAKLAAGARWTPPIPNLVFTTSLGQPRNGSVVTHTLQEAMAGADPPRLRWHDLRAVHGGLLLLGGADISVVSKMLGHSAIGVTAKHYAGVSDVLGRKASDRLAALFSQTG
jgi:integrase